MIELKNKDKIKNFLEKEMMESITKLVSLYMIELSGDEEVKKTIDTMMFMESMFKGGGFPSKDTPFIERHATLLSEIHAYNSDIKLLAK